MLVDLIAGVLLLTFTVAIHGAVISLNIRKLQLVRAVPRSFLKQTRMLAGLAVWCVLAHLVEIAIWATFYVAAGVMPDFETASYFSAVTYATIGYGDVVPPEGWRLLAAMEGLAGILMCAWSGGFIFAIVVRLQNVADRDR
jgi:hypothetical protein